MKNIILLNIVTQFELEHALYFLFRVSKQTRRMIPKNIKYLEYVIPTIQHSLKFNGKNQEILISENSISLIQDNLRSLFGSISDAQLQALKTEIKQKRLIESNKYNSKQRKLVNLFVHDPKNIDTQVEIANQQFPQCAKLLYISTPMPSSLTLTQTPKMLQFGIDLNFTLPIYLLQQITQVHIMLSSSSFNVKFQGQGKLGKNIRLYFCKQNWYWNRQRQQWPEEFADQYAPFFDFESCNYSFIEDEFSWLTAMHFIKKLRTLGIQTMGEIFIKESKNFDLIKLFEYFDGTNFKILTLTIKKDVLRNLEQRRIRVEKLIVKPRKELNMSIQNLDIEQKLVLRLNNYTKNLINIVQSIEKLPQSIKMHIKSENQLNDATKLLHIIHQKQEQVKNLKIKGFEEAVISKVNNFKQIYKSIGIIFNGLQKLTLPYYEGDLNNIQFLQEAIDNNRFLQIIKIRLIRKVQQQKCVNIKNQGISPIYVQTAINDQVKYWSRPVKVKLIK